MYNIREYVHIFSFHVNPFLMRTMLWESISDADWRTAAISPFALLYALLNPSWDICTAMTSSVMAVADGSSRLHPWTPEASGPQEHAGAPTPTWPRRESVISDPTHSRLSGDIMGKEANGHVGYGLCPSQSPISWIPFFLLQLHSSVRQGYMRKGEEVDGSQK